MIDYDPYQYRPAGNEFAAALFAGRRLTRLWWHLQQGWLLACDYSPNSSAWKHFSFAEQLLDALAVSCYETSTSKPDRLFSELEAEKEHMRSEGFSDDLYCAHLNHQRYEPRVPYDTLSSQALRFSNEYARPQFSRIRNRLLAAFSENALRLLEVGETVEEGLCSPDVARFCWTEKLISQSLSVQAYSAGASAEELSGRSFCVCELPPKPTWHTKLIAVLSAAGVDSSNDEFAHFGKRLSGSVTDLGGTVDTIVEFVFRSLAIRFKSELVPASFLGINFDRMTGFLQRDGFQDKVTLPKLPRKIFGLLLAKHGEIVAHEELRNLWDDVRNVDNRIHRNMNRLSQYLGKLRLCVENDRKVGYRLAGTKG